MYTQLVASVPFIKLGASGHLTYLNTHLQQAPIRQTKVGSIVLLTTQLFKDWVNLSKIVGKDRVFRRLAELLRGISRGRSPKEIHGYNARKAKKYVFEIEWILLKNKLASF